MCAVKESAGGDFSLVWVVFLFNKRLEIFTGCDDDVFVELPK